MAVSGKLYLLPVPLGPDANPKEVLPETVEKSVEFIDYYIVENEKTARRFKGAPHGHQGDA